MLFNLDDSGRLCRGCNETLDENDKRRGFFCSYCKGVAESHYTGFWSAIEVKESLLNSNKITSYAIGEFATYLEADICVSQRRWIKGFTSREEVCVALNALAEFHKGYAVSDTVTTLPHPVYVDDSRLMRKEGRI